jgi:hypothetical protein
LSTNPDVPPSVKTVLTPIPERSELALPVWQSSRRLPGFWVHKANRVQFFDWVASELKLKHMEEWYDVKVETIHEKGGSCFVVTIPFAASYLQPSNRAFVYA